MNSPIKALLIAICGILTAGSATKAQAQVAKASVYRYYSSDRGHLWHTQAQTIRGYSIEGVAFKVNSTAGKGAVALYRCAVNGTKTHFLSTDQWCEGQIRLGLLGFGTAHSTNAPLYRFYHRTKKRHLVTIYPEEAYAHGYTYEGVLAYVFR